MTPAETLIAQLPEGEPVSLAKLTRIAPEVDTYIRGAMAREGIVQPTGKRAGVGGSYVISWDDAVLVLVAVALAVLASASVLTVARVIKSSGLDPMVLAHGMKT
jgi:hypothetical protein